MQSEKNSNTVVVGTESCGNTYKETVGFVGVALATIGKELTAG